MRFGEGALQRRAGVAVARAEIGHGLHAQFAGVAQRRVERVGVLLHAADVVRRRPVVAGHGIADGGIEQLVGGAGLKHILHAEAAELGVDKTDARILERAKHGAVLERVLHVLDESPRVGFPITRDNFVHRAKLAVEFRAQFRGQRHELDVVQFRRGIAGVAVAIAQHQVLAVHGAPVPERLLPVVAGTDGVGALVAAQAQQDAIVSQRADMDGIGALEVKRVGQLRQGGVGIRGTAQQVIALGLRRVIRHPGTHPPFAGAGVGVLRQGRGLEHLGPVLQIDHVTVVCLQPLDDRGQFGAVGVANDDAEIGVDLPVRLRFRIGIEHDGARESRRIALKNAPIGPVCPVGVGGHGQRCL